jgi:hypothetical protein
MQYNQGMDKYRNKVVVNESNFAYMVDKTDWCVSQENCLNSVLFENIVVPIPHSRQGIVPSQT